MSSRRASSAMVCSLLTLSHSTACRRASKSQQSELLSPRSPNCYAHRRALSKYRTIGLSWLNDDRATQADRQALPASAQTRGPKESLQATQETAQLDNGSGRVARVSRSMEWDRPTRKAISVGNPTDGGCYAKTHRVQAKQWVHTRQAGPRNTRSTFLDRC